MTLPGLRFIPVRRPPRLIDSDVPLMVHSMKQNLKRLPARFYRSGNGREPVREWLRVWMQWIAGLSART